MKRYLIFLLLIYCSYDNAMGQNLLSLSSRNISYDSTSSQSSFSFIQLGGQVIGGGIAGTLCTLPLFQLNPNSGVIGWLAGSSLGVYLIGNIGGHSSSYLGTLLGGTVGSGLYLLIFNKSIDSLGALYIATILTSIPFEILSYYLLRSDTKGSPDISGYQSNSHSSYSIINNPVTKPDFSIQLINISF